MADDIEVLDTGADVDAGDDSAQDELSILESIGDDTGDTGDGTQPDPDKAPVDGEQKDDQPPADGEAKPEQTDEEKAAAAKAEAEAKPKEGEQEPKSVSRLREAINKDPELKALLNQPKFAKFRNAIYADARRSEELGSYKKHFSTPELAEQAFTDAGEFSNIDVKFRAGTPEASEELLQQFNAADTKGYTAMVSTYRNNHLWPYIEKAAEQAENKEEVQAALKLVKQLCGDVATEGGAKPVGSEKEEKKSDLSTEDSRYLELGKNAELQQRQAAEKADREYEEAVKTDVRDGVTSSIQERVDKVASTLHPAVRKRITEETRAAIGKIAKEDTVYQRTIAEALRKSDRSPEAKQKMRALAVGYAKERMNEIIREKVKEFSDGPIKANQEKHAKLQSQKENAQEPRGAGGVAAPSHQDTDSMVAEAARLKRELFGTPMLNDNEILDIEEYLPKLQRLKKQRTANK